MSEVPIDSRENHSAFLASPRKHVLMITNHGIHQWEVVPGLPDTGGQNVFVNQFSEALARLGFRITIVNRGGYRHPATGEWQKGLRYSDRHQRILYLEDGVSKFVRKEDMDAQIPALVESLVHFLNDQSLNRLGVSSEGIAKSPGWPGFGNPGRATPDPRRPGIDLIISHYWDAAKIGVLYNQGRPARARHIWVPHSLGAIKKRNVSPERWAELRIDERISTERSLVPDLDGIAATSSTVRQALVEDYGYTGPFLFLPPCVDTDRYHRRDIPDDDGVWEFLGQRVGASPQAVRGSKIVTEISRTDTTKRKDVLIKAFAQACQSVPNCLLVVAIDDNQQKLAGDLRHLIESLDLQNQVVVVGSVWDLLPTLYAITDVYCTPSVMEGFGMSAQEAAATRVPVVASHLVPFVTEYLLGTDVEEVHYQDGRLPLRVGEGAIAVQADDVEGFAHALGMLLGNDQLRRDMGGNAYHITVPYFTWQNMVTVFLEEIDEATT